MPGLGHNFSGYFTSATLRVLPRVVMMFMLFNACSSSVSMEGFRKKSATNAPETQNKTDTPTFSVAEGTYSSTQSVTITSSSEATIYYTTDNTAPTAASVLYTTPISVTSTMTIKAFAAKSGFKDSDVASVTYTISAATTGLTANTLPSVSIPGASATVYAIIKDSYSAGCQTAPHCMIIGGSFTVVGGTAANRIARVKPDGSVEALGTGFNNSVTALAFDSSGNLYAGGGFTNAGGIAANRIAKWNGSSWSDLGAGMNTYVYALAFDASGNLYAGGGFTCAGGSTSSGVYPTNTCAGSGGTTVYNRIAKWNGSMWSALGTGMDNIIYNIAFDSAANLYAGGSFTNAGSTAANRIAKWSGGTWSSLGTGLDAFVQGLAIDSSGNVYAGGGFETAGGVAANRIAKYGPNPSNGNNVEWQALGTGMNLEVYGIIIDTSGKLSVAGKFNCAGGSTSSGTYPANTCSGTGGTTVYNKIAQWDPAANAGNGQWTALGTGLNDYSFPLAFDSSGNLFAGGDFSAAGGTSAAKIAKWNGSTWSALTTGTNSSVTSFAIDSFSNIYAGGGFKIIGGVPANYIAKWNGTTWSTLGTGMNNYVSAVAFDSSGNLYAGGDFTTAGGTTVNYIAKWDGTNWSPLGTGTNGTVYALAFDSFGNLYAGGAFTTAGGTSATKIAKWNGSTWSALGSGLGGLNPGGGGYDGTVYELAFDSSGNLYAGGFFFCAGGSTSTGSYPTNTCSGSGGTTVFNSLAKWDPLANGGTGQWSALGTGLDSSIGALVFDSAGRLYAGGAFTNIGGTAANKIAMWNGTSWSALGTGMNSSVNAIAFDSAGNLYAGGQFTCAGGSTSSGLYPNNACSGSGGTDVYNGIAKWNGTTWSPLGTGIDITIYTFAFDSSGNLFAGGLFGQAGGLVRPHIAKWMTALSSWL